MCAVTDRDEFPAAQDEVYDVLHRAARFLQGEGEAPDYDNLTDEVRSLVLDLLPAVIEMVDDRIAPVDSPAIEPDEERVVVVGTRLRDAREAAGMTSQDLAVAVSSRGRTIGSTSVEAIEAALETPVDVELAAAIAEVLGTEDFGPESSIERPVVDDVLWGHPHADVRRDPLVVHVDVEPIVRLVASDFGLVARIVVFDTSLSTDLRSDSYLAVAEAIAAVDGGTTEWFLLVAAHDPERVTQVVHASELREVVHVPHGERVRGPRRHPVVLVDAVRLAFEDVLNASWDEAGVGGAVGMDVDIQDIASEAGDLGIAEATKTRARSDAKREGLATIGDPEGAALKRLLSAVTEGTVTSGVDFRATFDDELVGAA